MNLRQSILVAILLAVAGTLAYLHVQAQRYYPVAQVATPDGFTYTVVQTPQDERALCGEANDRFLIPVRVICKGCKVVYARCERKLVNVELGLSLGSGDPHHMVVSPGLRMKVEGPRERARAACDQIAADIIKMGYSTASCVYPRGTPAG